MRFNLLHTIIATVVLCLLSSAAQAKIYDARYVSTIDADTHKVEVSTWLQTVVFTSVRLRGIDTPETTWRANRDCRALENEHGEKASEYAEKLLQQSIFIEVINIKADKFGGRVVANIRLSGGKLLSEMLVSEGYAVSYDGGKKPNWCDILK